jgi:hypothetical protein
MAGSKRPRRANRWAVATAILSLSAHVAFVGTASAAVDPAPFGRGPVRVGGPTSADAVPLDLSPDGASGIAEPVLTWSPIAGASGYRVQIAAASDFSNLVYDVSTTNIRATPDVDLTPGVHGWRVAVESAGVPGTFATATWTKVASLTAPVQLGPSDGVTLQLPAALPRLEWTAVAGAASYSVEMSSAPDLTDSFSGVTRATSWVLDFLVPGEIVYWRVRAMARNGATAGPWSPTRSVAVAYAGVPGGLAPSDGTAAAEMVVGWDPLPGAKNYDLAFTPGPNVDWDDARTAVQTLDVTRFAFDDPTATAPVTWAWRVRARDVHGNLGPWTEARLITRSLAAGPTLTSPANGTHVAGVAVLQWDPVAGASHYRVDVSPDQTFATGLDSHVTTETTFDLTTREEVAPYVLVKGTTYYWRVRGLNRAQDQQALERPASSWSSSRTFVYDPPVATLLSPVDNAVVAVPTLRWSSPGTQTVRVTIKDKHGTVVARGVTYADSFTPEEALNPANEPFTWFVERVALPGDAGSVVAWTSAVRSFDLGSISASALSPDPDPIAPGLVTPSMSWDPVVGVDHYDVFLGTALPPPDAAFAGLALNKEPLRYPAFTYPNGDFDIGVHDFHVRAYDADGNTLATGALGTFTLQSLPAPFLTGPDDCGDPGCPVLAETPRLAWDPVPGASIYIAGVGPKVPDTVVNPVTSIGEVSLLKDPSNASAAGAVGWWVYACVERRCGPAGEAEFRKEAPAIEPVAPADEASVVGPQVTLSWNDLLSSPALPGTEGAPATEDWFDQVSFLNGTTGFSLDGEAHETTVILAPGTWQWGARAYAGSGVPSTTITRSLAISFPGPTPVAPADGAAVDSVPSLAWEARPFLSGYEVEVFRGVSTASADRVVHATPLDSGFTPFDELDAGIYTWRVRSIDAVTPSAWSSLRTFTINSTAAPALTVPADEVVNPDSHLLFTWTATPGAVAYRFESAAGPSFATSHETVVTGQTAWAPSTAYPNGTWSWRVRALGPSGAILATSATRMFILDDTLPTTTGPVKSIAVGATIASGALPVRLVWTGSDNVSGVDRYELSQSTDGGPYVTISSSLISTSTTRNLPPSHTYRFRVRAIDRAGNLGSWAEGSTFRLRAFQQSSVLVHYHGTWATSTSSGWWGGTAKS